MNPLPALTAPCPVIFFSNLSNTEEVSLVANSGKTSLAKGTAILVGAFFPKLPNQEAKDSHD